MVNRLYETLKTWRFAGFRAELWRGRDWRFQVKLRRRYPEIADLWIWVGPWHLDIIRLCKED